MKVPFWVGFSICKNRIKTVKTRDLLNFYFKMNKKMEVIFVVLRKTSIFEA